MRLNLALLCVCLSTAATAQDRLEPVRELYASADYEGALSALGRITSDAAAGTTVEVDRYRVLCLVALGRSAEADTIIEQILINDPLYDVAAADVPPRIRAAFSRVRERVLPRLARDLYADGKAAFDAKNFDRAATKLEQTLRVLENANDAAQPDMADLRTLAKGFLELSRASITPVLGGKKPVKEVVPNPAPVAVTKRPDSDPIAVRQVLPPWVGGAAGPLFQFEFRGAIEVDIDEKGLVVGAAITQPIHPTYDALLLQAARDWTYQPAYRDGKPARVRKRVDVILRPK